MQLISLPCRRTFALLVLGPLLCSCASFAIHDESRAKLSADAKQNYDAAKVTDVVEADRKNLELLLGEEIKAVRANYATQVDFATLAIANDSTPMARTYVEARERLTVLGIDSIGGLRKLMHAEADRRGTQRTLDTYAKVFLHYHVQPPDCANPPAKLPLPDKLSAAVTKMLSEEVYVEYKKLCDKLGTLPEKGVLAQAFREWNDAKKLRDESAKAQGEADAARKAYEAKLKEAKDPANKAQDFSADLAARAKLLAQTVENAKKLGLGVDNNEQIDALVTLLTAVAGGDVNPKDPELAHAAAVAKAIPSLAADIDQLQTLRTAPPVSGLLIALRHQTLLADAAKKRVALADERVGVLKAKYDAYYAEASHLLHFTDAVCSYAGLADKSEHLGSECDKFAVDEKGSCTLDAKPMPKCRLDKPWNEALRAKTDPQGQRELYKAVAFHLQALAMQSLPLEETYREIDVRHRETLLARQVALQAWDNLVSVPLEQLNGYYQGGVKPAEIADLIVKALGFTAIAIGVSK